MFSAVIIIITNVNVAVWYELDWVGREKWEVSSEVVVLVLVRCNWGRDRRMHSYWSKISKIWHLMDTGERKQRSERTWSFSTCANEKMKDPVPAIVTYVAEKKFGFGLILCRLWPIVWVLVWLHCMLTTVGSAFCFVLHFLTCLTFSFFIGLAQWFTNSPIKDGLHILECGSLTKSFTRSFNLELNILLLWL